jgi:hypothetical protein
MLVVILDVMLASTVTAMRMPDCPAPALEQASASWNCYFSIRNIQDQRRGSVKR